MSIVSLGAAVVGGLLLFFLPGYAVTKALFPEWRLRGPDGPRRAVETLTLSFVTSIGLTVVVGFGILDLAPGGFSAAWSDPVLEGALAAVAAVAFVASVLRGAWSREAPRVRVAPGPGEEGAWELSRELERLARDERRLQHALRSAGSSSTEGARISAELESVRAERDALRKQREDQYAS
ncbi:MAG TPA: DUF1616 domain-containing protein [Thermoplasmata archaeon]|jgi:hypothetical protein|nr:DUF1616 domain-containing protein [Thermoplasmata archaeon]